MRSALACGAAAAVAIGACRGPAPSAAQPEPASLTWEGAIRHAGVPLELTVELRADSTGSSGIVDVPHLYALGLPLQNVRLRGDSVHFELPAALPPGAFDGVRAAGRLRGTFRGLTDVSDSVRGSRAKHRHGPACASISITSRDQCWNSSACRFSRPRRSR